MTRQVARVLYPGGEERTIYPLNLKKFSLGELQKMVGGYIEIVILPRGNGHSTAYVNEMGRLNGMEYNANASAIYLKSRIYGPMAIISTEKVKEAA